MSRKRLAGTALQSWDDVDQSLESIGQINRELALIEAGQNEAIDKIKAEAKASAAPWLDKKAALELAMKEFCEANRAEFTKTKTRLLTFGSVGFRLSSKVIIKRVSDTLQALKDLGLSHCLRQKEELDKEAMKSLSAETLAEVGASVKTENAFGYEINLEKIREG
jgi:phage host-nuclease inhibitor protein Gam